jgi:hypothetical protein
LRRLQRCSLFREYLLDESNAAYSPLTYSLYSHSAPFFSPLYPVARVFCCSYYVINPMLQVTLVEERDPTWHMGPRTFWQALGGAGAYAKDVMGAVAESARFFACSFISGEFEVEPVPHFSQRDLKEEGVVILDTAQRVYVWYGAKSVPQQQRAALDTGRRYLDSTTATVLEEVYDTKEPLLFTAAFQDKGGWERKKVWEDPRERRLREMREAGNDCMAGLVGRVIEAPTVVPAATVEAAAAPVPPVPEKQTSKGVPSAKTLGRSKSTDSGSSDSTGSGRGVKSKSTTGTRKSTTGTRKSPTGSSISKASPKPTRKPTTGASSEAAKAKPRRPSAGSTGSTDVASPKAKAKPRRPSAGSTGSTDAASPKAKAKPRRPSAGSSKK